MKTLLNFVFTGLLVATLFSCDKTENNLPEANAQTIIDAKLFDEIKGVALTAAQIKDDILEVTIGASGCDGNTWIARLISQGDVIKTNPPQREVKIELINILNSVIM